MTTNLFGIYGFNFHREIKIENIRLVPLYQSPEAETKAGDEGTFHLTGYGIFQADLDTISEETEYDTRVRHIEDAMTFCEQRWIMTTKVVILDTNEKPEDFIQTGKLEKSLNLFQNRPSPGCIIARQSYLPYSRSKFLNLCVEKLADESFDSQTEFRKAFYRQTENLRMRQQFVDILYYFIFSGLEILARKDANNSIEKNVAVVLTQFIEKHDFSVAQKEVENWAHLRNALFHNGQFETEFNDNGTVIKLNIENYLYRLDALLHDILLKMIGFDDGHINWNRWQDRMPFS